MSKETKAIIENIERMDAQTIIKGIPRLDETQSAFLARQLTYVRARVLQVPHARLNSFTVFPVQTEVPAGAETALQRTFDMVGMAKIIANPADDLPLVDMLAMETSVKVKDIGAAYAYSVMDLEHAAFANTPLTTMKASAVRRSIDALINKIAWNGDAESGVTGFLNNENVSEYTLPADGTDGSTKFSAKTPVQMWRDMSGILESISDNTDDTERANTVIMATAVYNALATTLYVSDNGQTTQTVLDMLKANYPEVTRWLKVSELNNADSTGTKDLIVAGVFDPDIIRLEIPLRFEQRPVQEKNLSFQVPCRAKVIGVTVTRPYCFTKAVGA